MNGQSTLLLLPPSTASDRFALLIAGIVVSTILLAFFETARSMAAIWQRSETFGHGYFVVPIVLWLIWRRRSELSKLPLKPFWPGLLLVAASGFLWLLGSLADANVVKHFALVLVVQTSLLSVLGIELARRIAFALLFLFFAVPFGEAFVPQLIDWTADFAVFALKISGIPVFREGNNFQLPSGRWSVVETCSGIRYLIATLMAGTLYAYLMYRAWWKRAVFIAASVVVSIVANWLRAYLIVMLGHVSGNRLAVDVDHLIYGWFFFGLVLLLLFWVGARFREDLDSTDRSEALPDQYSSNWRRHSRRVLVASALVTVVVAGLWPSLNLAMVSVGDDRPREISAIEGTGGWRSVPDFEDGWRPRFSGFRSALRQVFERQGERVVVYVAYYAGQQQNRELINSANTLVTAEDRRWHEIARGRTELEWQGTRIEARTATIAKGAARFDVAWWYWIDGSSMLSEARAKASLAFLRLSLRPDDSAAVFVYAEPAERTDSIELLRAFAADMGGPIERSLASTRDRAAQ